MLVAEYDYDTDIAVQREESLRIGIQQGIQQGIEQGIEQGKHDTSLNFAKNMLKNNYNIESIMEITGLSREEIEGL